MTGEPVTPAAPEHLEPAPASLEEPPTVPTDPKPYRHKAYGDRSAVPLFDYVYDPRTSWEETFPPSLTT